MAEAASSKLQLFVRFCAIAILPVILIQLFPGNITLFQLLESFLIQTLIGAIILGLISILIRELIPTVSFIAVASVILYQAYPYYWPFAVSEGQNSDLTIGHYNLWHHNENPSNAIDQIIDQNADIIGIQELNYDWLDQVGALEDSHPYSFIVPQDTCCYGIGLYSRFPITFQDHLNIDETPALEVEVLVNDRKLKLLYLHTRPPAFPDQSASRNKQLDLMGQRAARTSSSWVLFGDFNIVPWAKEYRSLMEKSEGRDARWGFHATFPADYIPLIPIDHVVHSKEMTCTAFKSFSLNGSDHNGILAALKFD